MTKKPQLSKSMSLTQFDNGYWYATELKAFAVRLGIPSASKLRKDELEKAVRAFIRTGKPGKPRPRELTKKGPRDTARGLRRGLRIAHYIHDKETKAFILREALKIDPNFKIQSGTRYKLNRWKEEQIAKGRKLTYGDLVQHFVKLNQGKRVPLRMSHGRYNNFVADFMAANPKSNRKAMIKAWEQLKKLDAPKTYKSWAQHQRR